MAGFGAGHLASRLDGFKVAVLPVVLAMSDSDATLLARWVRNGGTLVAVDWNKTGIFDEDYHMQAPCPASANTGGRGADGAAGNQCSRSSVLQGLLANPGNGTVKLLMQEVYRYVSIKCVCNPGLALPGFVK